jgi:hypothetical protein
MIPGNCYLRILIEFRFRSKHMQCTVAQSAQIPRDEGVWGIWRQILYTLELYSATKDIGAEVSLTYINRDRLMGMPAAFLMLTHSHL